jgi:competence protein ComEA
VIPRSQRFVFLLVATVLAILMLEKGHSTHRKVEAVAFLHSSTAQITVRLKGAVPAPGVYRVPVGSTPATVMNMTVAGSRANNIFKSQSDVPLKSGDIVEVIPNEPQRAEITVTNMSAKERMVLGIPLSPDVLDIGDWDALPGIGPELAKRIVGYRQKHGAFGSLDALKRVPGIGEGKISIIRHYFTNRELSEIQRNIN